MTDINKILTQEQHSFLKVFRLGNVEDNISHLITMAMSDRKYDNSTLSSFLRDRIEITNYEYDIIPIKVMYHEYSVYVENETLESPIGKVKFCKYLKEKGVLVKTGGKNVMKAYGVRYKI